MDHYNEFLHRANGDIELWNIEHDWLFERVCDIWHDHVKKQSYLIMSQILLVVIMLYKNLVICSILLVVKIKASKRWLGLATGYFHQGFMAISPSGIFAHFSQKYDVTLFFCF